MFQRITKNIIFYFLHQSLVSVQISSLKWYVCKQNHKSLLHVLPKVSIEILSSFFWPERPPGCCDEYARLWRLIYLALWGLADWRHSCQELPTTFAVKQLKSYFCFKIFLKSNYSIIKYFCCQWYFVEFKFWVLLVVNYFLNISIFIFIGDGTL